MKRYTLVMVLFIVVFVLSACSPDQISDAIEDCQNDPECYGVVDQTITEELEARGITGGLMSVEEITAVEDVLASYYIDPVEYPEELYGVLSQFLDASLNLIGSNNEAVSEISDRVRDTFMRDTFLNSVFLFRELNRDNRQYLTVDNTRYIVYKTGANSYHYEVQADYKYEFEIDTELNKVYFQNELLSNELFEFSDITDNVTLFKGMLFVIEQDILYYAYPFDGNVVGLYDLTTNERYEMLLYDVGFDVFIYGDSGAQFERYNGIEYTGTLVDFLGYIQTVESFSNLEVEVIQMLEQQYSTIEFTYQVEMK
ncbi:hypothetical protein [Candidatus Xianfuyuplasma coldseepsis]|uniref:Lipoprotein n=1 Tax=Candidatus Xianfuyuplasma coldseepsis TaxID=2782163 RepID=A0A7L7KSS7_9MOLU|nr:hypothetical protein [Xianfuyuplasma coldseepsis]QMS85870.1 hypothetical protein G4Z02_08960 [Xianfuyuplasma coldseepsis]